MDVHDIFLNLLYISDADTTVSVRDSISLSFCFSFVPYLWVILCPGNLSGDLFSVIPPAPWFF